MVKKSLAYEGVITIPQDTAFELPNNERYSLKRPITIQYLDWRGAGASIIITDLLNPKIRHSFGPNLEGTEDEIREAAEHVIYDITQRLDVLSKKNQREDSENKELENLTTFLQAAYSQGHKQFTKCALTTARFAFT